jgi:hypothetical protein
MSTIIVEWRKVTCTWADIAPELTPLNALEYSRATDKLAFCAELTGLIQENSRLLKRFNAELAHMAFLFGYATPKADHLTA